MNLYVISADRRLLEALLQSGEYASVTSVANEMTAALLKEAEKPGIGTGSSNSGGNSGSGRMDGGKLSRRPGDPIDRSHSANILLGPGDVWLVSDAQLDIHEAIALRRYYPDNKLIYMLSNGPDSTALRSVQTLCAAHGILYVQPYHTPEQAAAEVAGLCLTKERVVSKVITAIGALPQLGLTSSLIGLSLTLSRLSQVRIGILGMNGWNPGDSGFRYSAKYLDELWGSLQGKQLQAAELPGRMQQLAPGVHYLAGNRDLKKLYYYQTDGASWLIEKARECFDIVLIDAGSYADHALAAQSIHVSDLLLVQLHQGQQARAQWERMCEHVLQPVFQLKERQTMLLFNKMHPSPELENEKQLSRQLDMPYIGSLPYVSSFYRSEADSSLLTQRLPDYDKELQKVARALMHYYGLSPAAGAAGTAGAAGDREAARGTMQTLQGRERKGASWFSWMKSAREA